MSEKRRAESGEGVDGTAAQKAGRALMPETAAMVDELREVFGADRIDAAIAAGQRARREFLRREQSYGRESALQWLRRQDFPRGWLWAAENGREVGVRVPPVVDPADLAPPAADGRQS